MDNIGLFRSIRYDGNIKTILLDNKEDAIVVTSNLEFWRIGNGRIMDDLSNYPLPDGELVGAHLNPIDDTIILCMHNGDIILCTVDAQNKYASEVVGTLPSGAVAVSISPDHELVSIVDGEGKLLMLARSSVTLLNQVELQTAAHTFLSQYVSVGWGKKETQFHGSAGKQAAVRKEVIIESITNNDDLLPRLSWRHDSQYVACSFVAKGDDSNHRQIVMINRDGVMVSVKDPIVGLGQAMSWRQDGTLIAASQRIDGENRVIFIEFNGLFFSAFTLQDHDGDILSLHWNCNGSILAVQMSDGRVDLWTCSNDHWYLKQSIRKEIIQCIWSPIDPYKLYLSGSEDFTIMEMYKKIDRSECDFGDNLSCVAVIDGRSLLLTPFSKAHIPPPMSYAQLSLSNVPSCVSISCKGYNGKLLVGTCDKTLSVFEFNLSADTFKFDLIFEQVTNLVFKSICTYKENFIVLDEFGKLTIVRRDGSLDVASEIAFASMVSRGGRVVLLDVCGTVYELIDYHVKRADECSHQDSPLIDLHLRDNDFLFFARSFDEILTTSRAEMPSITSPDRMLSITSPDRMLSITSPDEMLSMTSLDEMPSVTSFILHPEFLCTTDHDGVLRFYPLNMDLWRKDDSIGEEFLRHTEGGAICVAVVPKAAAMIVQMPRGNLETVYPRAFVLSQVRRCLNSLAYKEAFLLCRRHRVDLNIIYDNNPELFMTTVSKFVADVKDCDFLNLFMSSLNSSNIVATRYGAFLKVKPTLPEADEGKVNRVCAALRDQFMENENQAEFAECIMTSWVCQTPPNYRAALEAIVNLTRINPRAVEKALKYLIFLVPAEKLYRVALGMYDLPLALSIARRSQMDPSEYVVFLEELHEITNEEYRKYRIDDFLQDYDTALLHLIESGRELSECLDYVKRHELYSTAFFNYRSRDPEDWKAVCQVYAAYLICKEDYYHASDMCSFAGDLVEACNLAIKAGSWRRVVGWSSPELCETNCKAVAAVLVEQKQFRDALHVLELYCTSSNAIEVAICGHLWLDALRITQVYRLGLSATIKAGDTHRIHLLDEMREIFDSYEEKATRLKLLQTQLVSSLDPEKIRQELEQAEGIDELVDGVSEMSFRTATSFAGSHISRLSRATTSKSKRKADRQRMRGKPGSPFEREYLRDILKDLMGRFVNLRSSNTDFIQFLSQSRQFNHARELQEAFDNLAGLIKRHCEILKRLVSVQEEKMSAEVLAALGLSPWSIPSTLQVDHTWKVAFEPPGDLCEKDRVDYLKGVIVRSF